MNQTQIMSIMTLIEKLAYIKKRDIIELTFEIVNRHNEEWHGIRDVPDSYCDTLIKGIKEEIQVEVRKSSEAKND